MTGMVRCAGCPDPAVVVVGDPDGGQAAMCRWCWRDAERASAGLIRAVRLVRDHDSEATP